MKKEEFPIELIDARTRKALTQAELAQELGVTERSVGLWERGKVVPRIGLRMTLAAHLLGADKRNYFLFDDELPNTGGDEKPKGESDAAVLNKCLRKALEAAQVSDVLKMHVSKALDSLPELKEL